MAAAIIAVLLALLVVQTMNLLLFRRPPRSMDGVSPATVSVCIPARNEERNIEACVRSLAGQKGVREVLVLDDESSDRTAAILSSLDEPSVRLLRGAPLPDGWRGKNWACHQLSEAAAGEWLLFTDADTIHEKDSVSSALDHAQALEADLLSLFPRQQTGSPLEKLIIPLLNFVFVTFFPAFMLDRSRDPRFHAANGQFLLFRRTAYMRIGGHASIRGSVVDDLALGKRIREEGLRLLIRDGQDLVHCRMYQSARGVIEGFTKNLFAAVGGSALRALGITLFLTAVFVLPPVMLAATGDRRWLAACVLGLILRLRVTIRRSDDSLAAALLQPVAIVALLVLLWRSMLRSRLGLRVEWKGREV